MLDAARRQQTPTPKHTGHAIWVNRCACRCRQDIATDAVTNTTNTLLSASVRTVPAATFPLNTPPIQGSKDDRCQIKQDHNTVQLPLLLTHTSQDCKRPYALWQPSPRSCCLKQLGGFNVPQALRHIHTTHKLLICRASQTSQHQMRR